MFFRNNLQRATAYAASKMLEKILKDPQEQLPHGVEYDVSGQVFTIKLPMGTKVSRDAGLKGDGIIKKRATQNLYGYAVWAFFLQRLKKFNQANAVRKMLAESFKAAMENVGQDVVKKELCELDPELDVLIKELQGEKIAMRDEQTPRMLSAPTNAKPEILFHEAKKVAA